MRLGMRGIFQTASSGVDNEKILIYSVYNKYVFMKTYLETISN